MASRDVADLMKQTKSFADTEDKSAQLDCYGLGTKFTLFVSRYNLISGMTISPKIFVKENKTK